MSDLDALIAALAEHSATLRLSDDGEGLHLDLNDDAPDVPTELLAAVKARKPEIIAHLHAAAAAPADPPAPADAPIAEAAPPIFVMIDGRRQRLAVATITAPAPTGPALPRAVPTVEVLPYELTPRDDDDEDSDSLRFARARSRIKAMTSEQATLLEARLVFGDPDAWRRGY